MRRLLTYKRNQYEALFKSLAADGYTLKSALEFETLDQIKTLLSDGKFAIDVSTFSSLCENNPQLGAGIELLLHRAPDSTMFIAEEGAIDSNAYNLRTLFNAVEKCNVEATDIISEETKQAKTLVYLSEQECTEVLHTLDKKLIGQIPFKDQLRLQVKSFRIFNRLEEYPILSLLLIGPSGVGKTEVAKILCEAIAPGQSLPTINLGNYSSKDSLNSLIGSPRGYIGSEEGELALKINASQAGILLVDEFEKADSAIWSFFLDLLETGTYTDSQGGMHDLSGYLIVFTSNCPIEKLAKTFPSELLSRFSIKAKFAPLSSTEKEEFVEQYANLISIRYHNLNDAKLPLLPPDILIRAKSEIDVSKVENIRILKNQVRSWFVEVIEGLENPEHIPAGNESLQNRED